jgi:hypothetical protein
MQLSVSAGMSEDFNVGPVVEVTVVGQPLKNDRKR